MEKDLRNKIIDEILYILHFVTNPNDIDTLFLAIKHKNVINDNIVEDNNIKDEILKFLIREDLCKPVPLSIRGIELSIHGREVMKHGSYTLYLEYVNNEKIKAELKELLQNELNEKNLQAFNAIIEGNEINKKNAKQNKKYFWINIAIGIINILLFLISIGIMIYQLFANNC